MNIWKAGTTTLLAACLLATTPALADGGKQFASTTRLSGAQEVPSNGSAGKANATIRFERDFSAATIRVRFNNLEGAVTRLHLHCNLPGKNGPIALGLIDFVAPANDAVNVNLDGHRITGTVTNADFPDAEPCEAILGRPVNNIVSLAAAIEEGLIYWNLHSDAFPPGELRGQVRPLIATEDDRD